MSLDHLNFLGLKVSYFNEKQLEIELEKALLSDQTISCYGYSIGIFPMLKFNPELIEICNTFDIMVSDGHIFHNYVNSILGSLSFEISIPQLTLKTIELANVHAKKITLFGGSPHSNKSAIKNLESKYPHLKSIDGINGFIELDNEAQIVKNIRNIGAEVLLIGLPSPYKECFTYKYKNELNAKIIIPCGGMIDVLAGTKILTPNWIKKIGFAWLFRFVQNPFRRLSLTTTYIYYYIFKLLPYRIKIKWFNKRTMNSILELL